MAEDIKVSVVDEETPSAAEKEQEVLENSGVTIISDCNTGIFKNKKCLKIPVLQSEMMVLTN